MPPQQCTPFAARRYGFIQGHKDSFQNFGSRHIHVEESEATVAHCYSAFRRQLYQQLLVRR